MSKSNISITLASLTGLLAVGFGAFAAHGMSDPKAVDWLRTASQYAGIHALAVLACAALARNGLALIPGTGAVFLVGIGIFSGTLVAMALGAPRWLGAVTPIGGLCLMAGWAMLGLGSLRRQSPG
ncbi:MAG: DUF423 domain-containing protein [Caulobacter sp.]|nr:DUF423 domain-containing protein [Caulobacter sp.]